MLPAGLWAMLAAASLVIGAYLANRFTAGAVRTMLAGSMMPAGFTAGGRPVALLGSLGFAVAAVLTTLD